MFSDQTKPSEKITPAKGDKVFTRDGKCVKLLNASSSNIAKNLEVSEFNKVNFFPEETPHPILKAILKT